MANYNIVANSKFKPFSFDELLRPAAMATEAQMGLEDQYSDLTSKSNIWEGLTDKDRDVKTHEQYSKYSNDLNTAITQLQKEGLNESSRQKLMTLKKRYSEEITPIEQAYTRRATQIEEQNKGRQSGYIYDYNAADRSLDDYIKNTTLNANSINIQDIRTRSAKEFSNLAEQLRGYGEGRRVNDNLKAFITSYGITPKQAKDFTDKVNSGKLDQADPTLANIYNAIYNSSGVENTTWNDQAKQTVGQAILEGLSYGYGKTGVQLIDSPITSPVTSEDPMAPGQPGLDVLPLITPHTRNIADDMLDTEGNFKKDMSMYFKNGKFTKPQGIKRSTQGPFIGNKIDPIPSLKYIKNANYKEYDIINNALLTTGFSQEQINNMSEHQIAQALQNTKEGSGDAYVRQLTVLPLNASATKYYKETYLSEREKAYPLEALPYEGGQTLGKKVRVDKKDRIPENANLQLMGDITTGKIYYGTKDGQKFEHSSDIDLNTAYISEQFNLAQRVYKQLTAKKQQYGALSPSEEVTLNLSIRNSNEATQAFNNALNKIVAAAGERTIKQ